MTELCEHCKRNMPYLCEIGATCLDLQATFEAGRGQWISVEERFPEYNRFVPVVIGGVIQHQMASNCKNYWAWADESADYAPIEAVSLWFDLPAPPDSGDKGVGRD